MSLESLLLSRDPQVIRVLRQSLEKLSIDLEVCRGARSGNEILSTEKFDAVIVDCDDLQGGLEVLETLRKIPTNRTAVTFALLNGVTTTQRAFELGANFVLQKPISQLNATRCFSAGLGLMERERRRYFRFPIELDVQMSFSQGADTTATTSNISEGGMAIRYRGNLPKGGLSKVIFQIPGSAEATESKGDLAWSDGGGRAGVRFVDMPINSKLKLEEWLDEQMQRLEQEKGPDDQSSSRPT